MSLEAATALLKMAGQDYQKLKAQARDARVQARPAGRDGVDVRQAEDAHGGLAERHREAHRAAIPALKDEYVVYTAHWDHFGVGEPVNGDNIYNGALDNASGCAMVLEIARADQEAQAAAEAHDPVSDGDGRGAGPARLAVLRGVPALSAWRRRSPTSTSTASTSGAARRISRSSASARRISTTTRATAADRTGARAAAGRRAGEGLLLPLRSLQLREEGRARARSRLRHRLHRQAGRLRQAEARRVHVGRLPRAVGSR